MQEMDLLAALSRNLLPFPRLLGPLLLPGGRGQEILYICSGWLTHPYQGWQSMILPVCLLLQFPIAPQLGCLLLKLSSFKLSSSSPWAQIPQVCSLLLTKKIGHTLKPEAWVTTCSLRRTLWIAMSVPVDGEAKGDSEGMASCLVNDRSSLQIGDKYCWKQHSDRAFPLHSHVPAVAPDPGCPL